MNLIQCFLTNNPCYKTTKKMDVKGVLWHSTGANNPSIKRYVQPSPDDPNRQELLDYLGKNTNNNSWNNTTRKVGVNAFIGKAANGEIVTAQTMPWDQKPWGCASGSRGSCNDGWIQFEIAEDSLNNKTYFEQIYKEACELTAYLCKKFNIDPQGTVNFKGIKVPTILCHNDSYKLGLGNNHADVLHWFKKYGKTMQDVRDDVSKLLNQTIEVPKEKEEEPQKEFSPYIVRIIVSTLNVRTGPGYEYPVAMLVRKGQSYTIVDEQNGFGKLKSGAGWICLDDKFILRRN